MAWVLRRLPRRSPHRTGGAVHPVGHPRSGAEVAAGGNLKRLERADVVLDQDGDPAVSALGGDPGQVDGASDGMVRRRRPSARLALAMATVERSVSRRRGRVQREFAEPPVGTERTTYSLGVRRQGAPSVREPDLNLRPRASVRADLRCPLLPRPAKSRDQQREPGRVSGRFLAVGSNLKCFQARRSAISEPEIRSGGSVLVQDIGDRCLTT